MIVVTTVFHARYLVVRLGHCPVDFAQFTAPNLLYHFLENDYGNVTEIALQVAAWEEETTIEDVPGDRYQRIKASLAHNHLPRLADYSVIEYDARSGDIVARDGFDDFRSVGHSQRGMENLLLGSSGRVTTRRKASTAIDAGPAIN